MQKSLDDRLGQVEARNVAVEPDFAGRNRAVRPGLRERDEVICEGDQCGGSENPSRKGGDLPQQRVASKNYVCSSVIPISLHLLIEFYMPACRRSRF
jgi:hypothetical protein